MIHSYVYDSYDAFICMTYPVCCSHNATQCNNTLHRTVAHCDTLGMLPLSHKCVTTQCNNTPHHAAHTVQKRGFSGLFMCVAVCCSVLLQDTPVQAAPWTRHTATTHCNNALQHITTHCDAPEKPSCALENTPPPPPGCVYKEHRTRVYLQK